MTDSFDLQTDAPHAAMQVATACATTLKAVAARQRRLSIDLSVLKQGNALIDAKCSALGAETARLYRSCVSGRKLGLQKGAIHSHKQKSNASTAQ